MTPPTVVVIACVKPARRGPRAPKRIARSKHRIARTKRVRQRSTGQRAKARRLADGIWSGLVSRRAGGACEFCGVPGTDGHHVYGKGAHPSLRHHLENGVLLCRKCHRLAHWLPAAFRRWFARVRPESWASLGHAA